MFWMEIKIRLLEVPIKQMGILMSFMDFKILLKVIKIYFMVREMKLQLAAGIKFKVLIIQSRQVIIISWLVLIIRLMGHWIMLKGQVIK